MTFSRIKHRIEDIYIKYRLNRKTIEQIKNNLYMKRMYSICTLTLIGCMIFGGNQYVKNSVKDVYHVKVEDQVIGFVSNKEIIEQFKVNKKIEVDQNNPNARMIVETDVIELIHEKLFNVQTDDRAVLEQLDKMIVPKSIGVELKVNGKLVATVRDQQTANFILEQIKQPFTKQVKADSRLAALSDEPYYELNESEQYLTDSYFVDDIEINEVSVNPEAVEESQVVIERLQTGNVEPAKYTVVQGDCLSCIADKFKLTTEFLYLNNPWLKSDKLQIGDVLDITVLQPTISVKTLYHIDKKEEIRYQIEYIQNNSLRNGLLEVISPGKNGLKDVLYEITKVNGIVVEETILSEEIIEPPVIAKSYRGTRVVVGQGSGNFKWPVLSPRITSAYGMRWGTLHKGIDITGQRNIIASDNGKIEEAGYSNQGYGNYIIIDHMNGFKTLYGHLSQVLTSRGTIVEKGEKIGIMGSTGHSTGVHLHFEILEKGISLNPIKFLNR
jgi:murein DD-endopeptidase MepM/ murein hydrolase activator NlpD